MTFRLGTQNDIPQVYEIEQGCFTDSWSFESLLGFMNEKGRSVFVAEDDGKIVGYGATQQVLDECEILRVAVKPEVRKKGIGFEILDGMIRNAVRNGSRLFFLEVREGNVPAIGLYRKMGFVESGQRKDYYTNPKENAVLMSKCVSGTRE